MDEQVWKLVITIPIPSTFQTTKVEVQILQVSQEEERKDDSRPAYCVDFKRIEGSEIVYSDEVAKYLRWFDMDTDDEATAASDIDEKNR